LSGVAVMGFLGLCCLAVGGGLFALYAWSARQHAVARSWDEVPCVIVASGFVANQDSDGPSHRFEFVYEYQFDSRTFRGDRLDLVPGESGDEGRWHRELQEAYPSGTSAICYVDPRNPANCVFDRDRTLKAARVLPVLALPFFVPGLVMILACGRKLAGTLWRCPAPAAGEAGTLGQRGGDRLSAPPRSVGLWTAICVLLPPAEHAPVWLIFIALLWLFSVFDGPRRLEQLRQPASGWVQTEGLVTWAGPTGSHVLHNSQFQYDFRYEAGGHSHVASSFGLGGRFKAGDHVAVRFHPRRPERAFIEGTSESWAPAFLAWTFFVCLALLALLYLRMLQVCARHVWLLARGEIAEGWAIDNQGVPACQFHAAGREYRAQFRLPYLSRSRGDFSTRMPAQGQRFVVLFDPARPRRNAVFDHMPGRPSVAGGGNFVQRGFAEALPALFVTLGGAGLAALVYWILSSCWG
jgi:hypothetical protein